MWDTAGALLDGAVPELLVVHGVDLLAAWRARSLGAAVPEVLQPRERFARATALAVPVVLRRIREIVDGPLVLMKGPELACLYPEQSRGFGDVDVLVADADRVQSALVAAGFEEVNDPDLYIDIHHLRPLIWPTLPLKIELHTRPKWPEGMSAPAFGELLEAAQPSSAMPEGFLAPAPVHHVLIVAAHAWAHVPLRALRDLIDVAAVSSTLDRAEVAAVAERWGIRRIWETSLGAADALLEPGASRSVPLAVWARHIGNVRERSVFEAHLEQVLSCYWALPPRKAVQVSLARLAETFVRAEGDSWRDKCRRALLATRHAFRPRSAHDTAVGDAARRWRQSSGRR